jgi:hypothetical protein
MTVYYFNIRCDTFDAEDGRGQDCASLHAARGAALVAAGDLIREAMSQGDIPSEGWIEVDDAHHRPVFRLPLRSAAS